MEEKILFYVRLGDLRARVWFGIIHNLAVDMLLHTSFIDNFICGIIPAKHEVVPWLSHRVAILSAT